MYSQYCDLTPAGAVIECYTDMGARHHACAHSIHIITVEETAACWLASTTPNLNSRYHTVC
ncbi:60S ribosomal protein L18a [Lemmus lemmus]